MSTNISQQIIQTIIKNKYFSMVWSLGTIKIESGMSILAELGFYFILLWLEIVDCTGKIKILKKNIPTPPPARNPWRCQPQGWIHVCSLQIIYNIGTKILYETCFATKMLFLFCKSMIPVRFCTILPLHSCAGIKTRFKALFKKLHF